MFLFKHKSYIKLKTKYTSPKSTEGHGSALEPSLPYFSDLDLHHLHILTVLTRSLSTSPPVGLA